MSLSGDKKSKYNKLIDLAVNNSCEVKTAVPMSTLTTFKTGGIADVLILPQTESALRNVLVFCKESNLPYYILGLGSNVIAEDSGYAGVIFKTSGLRKLELLPDGVTIICGAGVPLSAICAFALENSLTGIEFAYGIPGTVGGGAYMNCGAYGGEMKDVLLSCRHLDCEYEPGELSGDALELGYRHSAYSENGFVITEITLRLQKGDRSKIKSKMDELISKRIDKQPLNFPSAGSTFKRPDGYFAGALIEQCGLKGYSIGDAAVSDKHAGFVINKGSASSSDILALIQYISDTVLAQQGVKLEPEVKIIINPCPEA